MWALCGLIAAAAVAYLHTEHAFRAFIVPLADATIDGSLGVEAGFVRAHGRIEATGLRYRGGGIEVEVEAAKLMLSPWSLLWGQLPRIDQLTLLGVRVETRPLESGGSPKPEAAGDPAWRWLDLAAPGDLPFAIERGRIEWSWLRRDPNGGLRERWTAGVVEIDDLAPGRRALLRLGADVELDPDEPETGYAGRAALDLELEADDLGSVHRLRGSGTADVAPLTRPDDPPLHFAFEVGGDASVADGSNANATARAVRGRQELGRAHIELHRASDPIEAGVNGTATRERRAPIRVLLELESLTHEFLNPLIAGWVTGSVESGVIDGSLDGLWSPDTNAFRARSDWKIRELRLRASDEQTPPLAVRLYGECVFTPAGTFRIPSGGANVEAGGRRSLDLRLLEPLEWRGEGAPPSGMAAAPRRPNLELRVERLEFALLRVGLSMLGLDLWEPLDGSTLDANLRVSVLPPSSSVDIAGTWQLRGLGEPPVEAAPTPSLSGVVDASIDPGRAVRIARLETELTRGDRPLASLRASGSALGSGSSRIDWALEASDTPAALQGLTLLPAAIAPHLRGGRLDALGAITRDASGAPLRISGTFRSEDLVMDAARAMTSDFTGSVDLAIENDAIAVERALIQRPAAAGDPAATLEVRGTLPLSERSHQDPAFFELDLEESDLRPWLQLYGLDPTFADEPLPYEAGWRVWVELPQLTLRTEGWQKLGLRSFGLREILLEHRATRSSAGVDEFEATLHGRRPQGPDDRVELTGSFRERSQTGDAHARLDLAARIHSLVLEAVDLQIRDSDLHADVALSPHGERIRVSGEVDASRLTLAREAAATSSRPLAADPMLDAPLPHEKLPAWDADLRLAIGRLSLPSNRIDRIEQIEGRLTLAGESGHLQLDRAHLWSGALEGDLAARWDEESPHASLRARLDGGSIAPFFEGQKAKGALDVELDLSVSGGTLRAMLASAAGEAGAKLGTAEFESPPLGVLGKDLAQILFAGLGQDRGGTLNCVVARTELEAGLGRVGVVASVPETTLAGGGALDLHALRADLLLRPRSSRATFGTVQVPIRIAGPLGDLRAGLDSKAIAQDSAEVVVFGIINPFLTVVPLIDLGTGDENPCETAFASLSVEQPERRTLLKRSRRLLEAAADSVRRMVDRPPAESQD